MTWLSVPDAAEKLGKTPAEVDAAVASGELKSRRAGWRVEVEVVTPRKKPAKKAAKKR